MPSLMPNGDTRECVIQWHFLNDIVHAPTPDASKVHPAYVAVGGYEVEQGWANNR